MLFRSRQHSIEQKIRFIRQRPAEFDKSLGKVRLSLQQPRQIEHDKYGQQDESANGGPVERTDGTSIFFVAGSNLSGSNAEIRRDSPISFPSTRAFSP